MIRLGMLSPWLLLLSIIPVAEAGPGTVNYIEGQVSLGGQPLILDSGGGTTLHAGEILETAQGRAEVLLTPGIFLRIGENSSLKLAKVSENDVRVELLRGEVLAEVDMMDIAHRAHLIDHGADAVLDRVGLYLFKVDDPAILVYSGKLRVEDDRRKIGIGQGEEFLLNSGGKPRKFDRAVVSPIYNWSLQRADYASQLSEWTGASLLALEPEASYTEGWYWNPWFKSWAYVPEKGFVLTPLGFGLFAPQSPHYRTPVFGDFRN